jgi:type II secretory pathway predicted ATPase ExeA
MYCDFWKLRELPFQNAPDAKFLYKSNQHAEALSRLTYLLRAKEPCGVFVGTYGCGKTLLLHAVQRLFATQGYAFSTVTNPRLSDLDMLRMITYGFTKGEVATGKGDAIMALERVLRATNQDGKHPVVVIDEAHAIEDEKVFEELRLLLNYQTETKSLLTLVLAGQSELKNKVESNKQLNQRVSMKITLGALNKAEVRAYIAHRLSTAGAAVKIFDDGAADAVFSVSGGIPRWINNICHMSMLGAFMSQRKTVDAGIVKKAVSSMEINIAG